MGFKEDYPSIPTVIPGGLATDDRGTLTFINGLNLSDFKRFYTVSNHSQGFIRAWHGHLLESKVIFILSGSALVCAVKMTNSSEPDKSEDVTRVVLTHSTPNALFIPAGYANGLMTLTKDARLLIFSNTTVEESRNDDYRFPFDYWNPWEIVQR
jgi:dTDP-4-dehydrorhamnose 3,5-epimerase-like enzyme